MRGFRLIIAAIFAAVSVAAVAACGGDLTGPEPTPISFDWGDARITCQWGDEGESYMICEDGTHCYQADSGTYACDNGCTVSMGDSAGYYCPDGGEEPCYEDCDPPGDGGSNPPPPPPECDLANYDCPDEPPPGVDPVAFESMSAAEKQFCKANKVECASYVPISMVAIGWAEEEAAAELVRPIDNKFDAMRHVFWSAALTRALGPARALAWTEVHEQGEPGGRERSCMDRFNNALGRTLAFEHPEYSSDLHLQNAARNMANAGVTKNAPYAC